MLLYIYALNNTFLYMNTENNTFLYIFTGNNTFLFDRDTLSYTLGIPCLTPWGYHVLHPLSLSHSLTNTRTHTRSAAPIWVGGVTLFVQSLSLSHTLSLSLSLSLSYAEPHFFKLGERQLMMSRSLSHTCSPSLTHTHALSHTNTLSLSFSLTHKQSCSLSLSHTHTLPLSLTHTHTPSLSHTHSYAVPHLFGFEERRFSFSHDAPPGDSVVSDTKVCV